MNERTNPRDITSQASSSAAASQEHLGGAHGVKPVATAPLTQAGAQPSVVVKSRATRVLLGQGEELSDALSSTEGDASTLVSETEAADPAPAIDPVPPAPVVADTAAGATAAGSTSGAAAATTGEAAGAASATGAAASTATATATATAAAPTAAAAGGSFFTSTLGLASMAGGAVVVGAAAGGGSSPAASPAPATDKVAPTAVGITLTTDSGNNTDKITNTAAISLSGVEAGATVEYKLDTGAWTSTYTAPTTDGAHSLQVRQTDAAGNISATTTLNFTLDTLAPTATPVVALANNATSLTNNATLTAVTPEAGATVEYRVDGGAWSTTYTAPTSNAAHTVDVRQTDTAGNASAATSLTFTLDTVAPTAPVVALANNATTLTNNATLTAVTPEAGATVEYRVDNGAWSGTYVAPTGDIPHTVDVRQTDAAGNVSPTTTLAFTLDTLAPAAPVVALVNGATSLTNNATLAAITPEAGATVEYRVDGGAWATAYTAPTSNAAHTVDVRQTDAAGNISPLSSLAFTLDTVAPAAPSLVLSGTQNPVGGPVTNSAIDLVGVEANAVVQYRVYTTGTTPSAWVSLPAVAGVYTVPSQPTSGLYSVDVQVTDTAGNISSLSSASFDLQGTAGPIATLVSDTGIAADLITSNGVLNIPASTTPGLTQIEYSADGLTGWTTVQPTWTEGLNTTHLRYADPAGAIPASLVTTFQFTLDTVAPTAPTLSLQTGTSALTNSSAVTLGGVETGATVEYSTDGTTWVAQQPAAVQGANTLYVRQIDVAGNLSAASTALTFTLDSVAPTAPVVATPAASSASTPRAMAASASLAGARARSAAIMTHASVPAETRAALGIADGFIRVSVGIEHVDDLREDLERGFAAVARPSGRAT